MARQPQSPLREARKGNSFNDRLMLIVGVPVVLAWVAFACLVIWNGLNDATVLDRVEEYGLLLGIISGPALLILNSMLELWKTEQGNEIQMQPEIARATITEIELAASHQREISLREQLHQQTLAIEQARHGLTGRIDGKPSDEPFEPQPVSSSEAPKPKAKKGEE